MRPTPSYEGYAEAVRGLPLPLAYVDLDLLEQNARALTTRAGPLPMRLATKSIRCRAVLRHLLTHFPAFRGLMAFAPSEAAKLAADGFDDILIGYPTMAAAGITACLAEIQRGKKIVFMVDAPEQAELLQRLAAPLGVTAPVCIDLDLSTSFPLLFFGVYRSPLRTWADTEALTTKLRRLPNLRLAALMGYEGQIAGVPDQVPGALLTNQLIRLLKQRSERESFRRRQQVVAGLQAAGIPLDYVNGGGTGSIEATRRDTSVTELTVGSGRYAPALFDHYRAFRHQPAAGFALPVVRQARPGIYACSGGGYVASGSAGADKQPVPYLPPGLKLFKMLGAGEVQTSLSSPKPLALGAPVFFRHAKAGEFCERFESLHFIQNGRVVDTVPTYRGDGWCFF